MMRTCRHSPYFAALLILTCGAFGAASEPIALAPEEGLLILKNGEVIAGRITQSGDRYYVALPHGELRLRVEDVALRCQDLADGYTKKRAALRGTRAEEHLDLAQWCLSHGLLDAAETEIRYAASLDGGHPRLRLMARRLELARSQPDEHAKPAVAATRPAADAEALEQLRQSVPAPVLQRFATTVQPLLINTCATASCHGAAGKSSFRLSRIRGQGDHARRQTLRNLRAVLDQIDRQRPQDSLLLTRPIEPHGGGKTAIFTVNNSRRYYELYEWVRLAAGDERRASSALASPALTEADHADSWKEDEIGQAELVTANEAGAVAEAPDDPYDPTEFNRATTTPR